jgi:class 3 adenylate cyclase
MVQKGKIEDHFLLSHKKIFHQIPHTVVFIDIVGFTSGERSNEDLFGTIKDFEEKFMFVFDPKEFWGDTPKDKDYEGNTMIMIPTGDGVAIGFDPKKPDIEILEYVRKLYMKLVKDNIVVRIGINKGESYVSRDLNHRENLIGWGIIHAQRIMDIADDNQILCSASFAQPLSDARKLKELKHIGRHKIKHGEEMDIYNYYKKDEFGNPNPPLIKYK